MEVAHKLNIWLVCVLTIVYKVERQHDLSELILLKKDQLDVHSRMEHKAAVAYKMFVSKSRGIYIGAFDIDFFFLMVVHIITVDYQFKI